MAGKVASSQVVQRSLRSLHGHVSAIAMQVCVNRQLQHALVALRDNSDIWRPSILKGMQSRDRLAGQNHNMAYKVARRLT